MPMLPNVHALVIGIAYYQHVNSLSPVIVKDAQEICNVLVDPNVCAYPPENVRVLLDGAAMQTAIRTALAEMASHSNTDSTIFFYFSGPYAGECLLPVDVVYTSGESLVRTTIAGGEFTAALRAIPARKVVVIFDCCHAAGIGQPKETTAPLLKTGLSASYFDALKEGRRCAILASSRSDEFSYVMPGAINSLPAGGSPRWHCQRRLASWKVPTVCCR